MEIKALTFLPIQHRPSTDSDCRRQPASAEPEDPRVGQLPAGNSADPECRATRRVVAVKGRAEFARRCQGIPGGWTIATGRPRPLFTRTRPRMPWPAAEASA